MKTLNAAGSTFILKDHVPAIMNVKSMAGEAATLRDAPARRDGANELSFCRDVLDSQVKVQKIILHFAKSAMLQ